MSDSTELLEQIENFLNASGVTATAFGKNAVNDANFVHALRDGRSPTARTMQKVRDYMRGHAAATVERLTPFTGEVATPPEN